MQFTELIANQSISSSLRIHTNVNLFDFKTTLVVIINGTIQIERATDKITIRHFIL